MNNYNYRTGILELNEIAIPLIINLAFGMLVSVIDQGMIGRLDIEAIGVIGAVGSILYTLSGVMGVIAITFNIYGGKALGKKREEQFENYFSGALLLNVCLGICVAIVLFLIRKPLLVNLFGFKDIQLAYSLAYLSILSISPLLQTLLFTFNSFFKIIKKTKYILICSTIATCLNVILNYLLIFGNWGFPRLEVRGAAIATIISLIVNLLLYVYICRKQLKLRKFKIWVHKEMICLLKKSKFLFLQEFLEGSTFVIVINVLLARIGILENYTQLLPIINIIFIAMHMYSTAVLTLVSKNISSKKQRYLIQLPKIALLLIGIITFILSIISLVFRFEIAYLLTPNSEFSSLTSKMLGITILANIFNPIYNVYKAGLQAIGRSDYVLYGTFAVNFASIILMWVLALYLEFGYIGISIGMFFNYFILSGMFYFKYTGKVKHEILILNLT